MAAEIIPFPGLIERVARRMLRVMEIPAGKGHEREFDRALAEFGIGCEGGLALSDEQWKAIWHRVYQMMPAKEKVGG